MQDAIAPMRRSAKEAYVSGRENTPGALSSRRIAPGGLHASRQPVSSAKPVDRDVPRPHRGCRTACNRHDAARRRPAEFRAADRTAVRHLPCRRVRAAADAIRAGVQARRIHACRARFAQHPAGGDAGRLVHAYQVRSTRQRRAARWPERQLLGAGGIAVPGRTPFRPRRRIRTDDILGHRPAADARQRRRALRAAGEDRRETGNLRCLGQQQSGGVGCVEHARRVALSLHGLGTRTADGRRAADRRGSGTPGCGRQRLYVLRQRLVRGARRLRLAVARVSGCGECR